MSLKKKRISHDQPFLETILEKNHEKSHGERVDENIDFLA